MMPRSAEPTVASLRGYDLGERTVTYDERDAILYALAVGASAEELSLVYERDLRALPTYALAAGLWAVMETHALGAYDPTRALHVSQRLEIAVPLERAGALTMHAQITEVWDKGSAAILGIVVIAREFRATYGIYLPGEGGWGGERGPARRAADPQGAPDLRSRVASWPEQAALYRLTGDRHPVHIDPAVAEANGFERPILHGLCTLGITALELARSTGHHPASLRELTARFTAPVLPGDELLIRAWLQEPNAWAFDAFSGTAVLADGRVAWAISET